MLTRYLQRERVARYRGFRLLIKPTVFHPAFFFSSGYLSDFIMRLDLKYKTFLELGCGSGLVSLTAFQKGAEVTCSDINPVAVECTRINFETNFGTPVQNFSCLVSDLFAHIPPGTYDVIAINPPYFFEEVKRNEQWAWNCGKNGEYFKKLFSGLPAYLHQRSEIYMILADNCDIKRISTIAEEAGFHFHLQEEKKIKWEVNYIFRISQKSFDA